VVILIHTEIKLEKLLFLVKLKKVKFKVYLKVIMKEITTTMLI